MVLGVVLPVLQVVVVVVLVVVRVVVVVRVLLVVVLVVLAYVSIFSKRFSISCLRWKGNSFLDFPLESFLNRVVRASFRARFFNFSGFIRCVWF